MVYLCFIILSKFSYTLKYIIQWLFPKLEKVSISDRQTMGIRPSDLTKPRKSLSSMGEVCWWGKGKGCTLHALCFLLGEKNLLSVSGSLRNRDGLLWRHSRWCSKLKLNNWLKFLEIELLVIWVSYFILNKTTKSFGIRTLSSLRIRVGQQKTVINAYF